MIEVKDGNDEEIAISYKIFHKNDDVILYKFNGDALINAIQTTSERANSLCNHPNSYIPLSAEIFSDNGDTILVSLKFKASNSFGVVDSKTYFKRFIYTPDKLLLEVNDNNF